MLGQLLPLAVVVVHWTQRGLVIGGCLVLDHVRYRVDLEAVESGEEVVNGVKRHPDRDHTTYLRSARIWEQTKRMPSEQE